MGKANRPAVSQRLQVAALGSVSNRRCPCFGQKCIDASRLKSLQFLKKANPRPASRKSNFNFEAVI